MKIPQLVLGCALPVMLASTGLARIGETLEECVERYGAPIERPMPQGTVAGAVDVPFMSAGGIIRDITFWHGKAASIAFYNEDDTRITPELAEFLLEENAGSTYWTKVHETLDFRMWETPDGQRRAWQDKDIDSRFFYTSTTDFWNEEIALLEGRRGQAVTREDETKEAFAAAEKASHATSLTRAERRTMEKAVWRARLVVRRSDTKYLNDLELADLYQKALPINKMQDVQGAINSLLNRKQ